MQVQSSLYGISMLRRRCWLCGNHKTTRHHVIPKSLKPIKNKVIPLCRKCHTKMHIGKECIMPHREVINFKKVKQRDGKYKMQGRLPNGKIVFPDHSVKTKVKDGKYYDCNIHQISTTAFATDMKEYKP